MARAKTPDTRGELYFRHALPVRLLHWSIVILLVILLMSGLNIFNAHPALYWGEQSYSGPPPFLALRGVTTQPGGLRGVTTIFGHDFDTTGFLGASRDPAGYMVAQGFPSWLTIPDVRWLAMARRWHFFFAWLLALNVACLVGYSLVSGHLRRDLLPTGRDWRSLGPSLVDHLRLRRPRGEAARHYNILQKLAYLAVIFILLPLIILMGLGMSPALDVLLPGWVSVFGGRQAVRTLHFAIAWTLVAFTFIHVFQVIVHGFWNNFRAMLTGYQRIRPEADHE
jgi:thiosulfate reductase cytochrome b subunit